MHLLRASRGRTIASNALAVAVRDRYPVTPLHSLLIPRRHAATFFDLFEPERRAINLLLDTLRATIISADQLRHCFRFRVDRLPPAVLVFTPMGNQTPQKSIKCSLSCLWVLSDNPMLLARSTIVVRGTLASLP